MTQNTPDSGAADPGTSGAAPIAASGLGRTAIMGAVFLMATSAIGPLYLGYNAFLLLGDL